MKKKLAKATLLVTTTLALSACIPANQKPDETYTPPVATTPASIPPDPIATQPVSTPITTAAEQYVVQLTASNSLQKAQNIRDKFAAEGYNAFVSPLNLNGRLVHRVQIGMLNDQGDANMVLAQMQVKYPGDPYVAEAITKTP